MKVIQRFGLTVSRFQVKIILFTAYVILVPLFAVILKFSLKDKQRGWTKWELQSDILDELKRQS